MDRIQRIAIVGGIHGNEWTGAYLVQKFAQYPDLICRSSFAALTLLGNPAALAANRRYIDKDLNRCFRLEDLQNPALTGYEEDRAREIYRILGPGGKTPVDLLIDLHSTTANMGLTLILGQDHPLMLHLAAALSARHPLVRVYRSIDSGREYDSLRSLCPLSLAIEVGPVPQGVLIAEIFQATEALIHTLLDALDHYNQGHWPPGDRLLTCYQYLGAIDYPRNSQGAIQAMIHPQLQSRDYQPLHPGSPLFLTFEGEAILYQGEATVYPIFINEAAYYEQGVALYLTEKQTLQIPGEGNCQRSI